jgi:hypothetical protein
MWDDEECPEFSPTRAIFLWLKVSGITSGFLFPSRKSLENGIVSPKEPIAYKCFLGTLKFLYSRVLNAKPDRKSILGTHILRKTAYLFAVWGSRMSEVDGETHTTHEKSCTIFGSARHSQSSGVAGTTYITDCETLWHLVQANKNGKEDNRVSKWKHILVAHQACYRLINNPSNRFQRSIIDLADHYIHNLVKIPKNIEFPVYRLHQLVCAFVPVSSKGDGIAFTDHLKTVVHEKQLEATLALFFKDRNMLKSQCANEYSCSATSNGTGIGIGTGTGTGTGTTTVDDCTMTIKRPTKVRKLNEDEIVVLSRDYQSEAKMISRQKESKSDLLKIAEDAVHEVLEQKTKGKILQDPLKTWANKAARAVLCIKICYKGNRDGFLCDNDKYVISRFKCHKGENHDGAFEKLKHETGHL